MPKNEVGKETAASNKGITAEVLEMRSKRKEVKHEAETSTNKERKAIATSKKESASEGLARLIAANSQEEAKKETAAKEVAKSMDPAPKKETRKETAASKEGVIAEMLEMLSKRKEMKNETVTPKKEKVKAMATSKKRARLSRVGAVYGPNTN